MVPILSLCLLGSSALLLSTAPGAQAALCPFPRVWYGTVSPRRYYYRTRDTVSVTCSPGYTLRGPRSSTCGAASRWDPPLPQCKKEVTCPRPPSIANGLHTEHSSGSFSRGVTVSYSCRQGFELLGKQCGHPGEPVNGKIISLTNLQFGSTVVYRCEEGHRLIGQASRRCEISGGGVAWTGHVPLCQRIPCEPPPDIPRGQHSGRLLSEFHYGTAVTYSCQPGFPLHGHPSVHCTTHDGHSGVWSEPLPACGEASCPVPQIQHGRIVAARSAYAHRDTVTFECEPGYAIRGHREIQCQPNNTWEPPVPVCEQGLTCAAPPAVPNGTHSGGSRDTFSLGDVVTYTCAPGLVLAGGASLSCTSVDGEHGTWSGAVPRCQEVTCPAPPSIANGQHGASPGARHSPGSLVLYTCAEGYSLLGNASIRCTAKGTWSRPQPRCRGVFVCSRAFLCLSLASFLLLGSWFSHCNQTPRERQRAEVPGAGGAPSIGCTRPEMENGKVTGSETTYSLEDTVIFECNFGYALKGSQESQCQFGGKWHPPVPTCEKLPSCPSPPTIRNGQHDSKGVTEFIPGMAVKYHCDPGYVLTGKTTVSCLPSGVWSIPYPWCEGFVLRGSRGAECQPDSHWVPAVPTCQPVRLCPPPPVIAHATLSAEPGMNFTSGTSVSYSCQPGFSLLGDPSVLCTAWGNWSHPYPRCAVLQCPSPPNIDKGKHDSQDLEVFPTGMVVNYSCDPGYSLQGEASIYCTNSGNWSLPLPQCAAPQIQNGRVAVPKPRYTYRDSVTFKCHRGFTLRGHPTSRCRGDRRWHPPVPVCEQAGKCLQPPNITNGRLKGDSSAAFPSGAVVSYSCDPGYSLLGNASITCTASGSWSQPLPRCQEIRCEFPDVQGVKKAIKGNTYRSGTNITLECDDGYMLAGISHTQCQEDFSWDPPVPACKLTSPKSGSVGLGVVAAAVLLLLGAGVVWKIISKQKEGYYHTYENYNYRTPLNPDSEHRGSCLP
uniref:complement receptor type 1 n=1 Tax=Lonchura striata TaxID=40157 RepID=UPI000B4DD182|nr:complement receptor type 1 [Lonchura striata domestica]